MNAEENRVRALEALLTDLRYRLGCAERELAALTGEETADSAPTQPRLQPRAEAHEQPGFGSLTAPGRPSAPDPDGRPRGTGAP